MALFISESLAPNTGFKDLNSIAESLVTFEDAFNATQEVLREATSINTFIERNKNGILNEGFIAFIGSLVAKVIAFVVSLFSSFNLWWVFLIGIVVAAIAVLASAGKSSGEKINYTSEPKRITDSGEKITVAEDERRKKMAKLKEELSELAYFKVKTKDYNLIGEIIAKVGDFLPLMKALKEMILSSSFSEGEDYSTKGEVFKKRLGGLKLQIEELNDDMEKDIIFETNVDDYQNIILKLNEMATGFKTEIEKLREKINKEAEELRTEALKVKSNIKDLDDSTDDELRKKQKAINENAKLISGLGFEISNAAKMEIKFLADSLREMTGEVKRVSADVSSRKAKIKKIIAMEQ